MSLLVNNLNGFFDVQNEFSWVIQVSEWVQETFMSDMELILSR